MTADFVDETGWAQDLTIAEPLGAYYTITRSVTFYGQTEQAIHGKVARGGSVEFVIEAVGGDLWWAVFGPNGLQNAFANAGRPQRFWLVNRDKQVRFSLRAGDAFSFEDAPTPKIRLSLDSDDAWEWEYETRFWTRVMGGTIPPADATEEELAEMDEVEPTPLRNVNREGTTWRMLGLGRTIQIERPGGSEILYETEYGEASGSRNAAIRRAENFVNELNLEPQSVRDIGRQDPATGAMYVWTVWDDEVASEIYVTPQGADNRLFNAIYHVGRSRDEAIALAQEYIGGADLGTGFYDREAQPNPDAVDELIEEVKEGGMGLLAPNDNDNDLPKNTGDVTRDAETNSRPTGSASGGGGDGDAETNSRPTGSASGGGGDGDAETNSRPTGSASGGGVTRGAETNSRSTGSASGGLLNITSPLITFGGPAGLFSNSSPLWLFFPVVLLAALKVVESRNWGGAKVDSGGGGWL